MLDKLGKLLLILNEYGIALFYLTYVTFNHLLSFYLSLIVAILVFLGLFIFVVIFVSSILPARTASRLISGKIIEARRIHYQIISFQTSNVIPFVLASYDNVITLIISWIMLFLFIVLSYNDVSILALNPYLLLREYSLYLIKVEIPHSNYKDYYVFSRDDLETRSGLELNTAHLYEIDNNLYIVINVEGEENKNTSMNP
ncbi:hypothetical protein HS7_20450 [Sulfolobales archaeon HS-7]|nr:hypothetical protein HS7_20450 [Sulfolobales archaeon HS-7]